MLSSFGSRRFLSTAIPSSRLHICSASQTCRRRGLLVSLGEPSEVPNTKPGYFSVSMQKSPFSTSTSNPKSQPTSSQPASSPFRLSSKSKRFSTPNPESLTHEQPQERAYRNPNEGPDPEELEELEGVYNSPYQPKRQWPPDMSKLSPKHQFRLERKYRRRAALKYARPRWVKWTKMAQWGAIVFVLIYSVLFMDWGNKDHPFDEFRKEFFASINSIFYPSRPEPVPSSSRREEDENRGQ